MFDVNLFREGELNACVKEGSVWAGCAAISSDGDDMSEKGEPGRHYGQRLEVRRQRQGLGRRRQEAEGGEGGEGGDMSWRHKGKGRSRRDRPVRLGQTTRRMDLISKNGIEQIACRQFRQGSRFHPLFGCSPSVLSAAHHISIRTAASQPPSHRRFLPGLPGHRDPTVAGLSERRARVRLPPPRRCVTC